MSHESKRDRRKRLQAARAAGNPLTSASRKKRRRPKKVERVRGGTGAFSETGFITERKRTSAEALRDIRVQEKIPGSMENTMLAMTNTAAMGKLGGKGLRGAGGFRGSTFQLGTAKGAAGAARAAGFIPSARSVLGFGAAALAGATAQQILKPVVQGVKDIAMHRGTGQSISTLPGVGGMLPAKDTVVKVWTTGTANFARLVDGRIAVQKKDGTIKVYRPQKHIVIPRNPRVGTLIRADKRLKRLTKGLRKVVKG